MRLAPFIRANAEQIIGEWEKFAATLIPAADDMNSRALRNHIKEILKFVADDIEAPQTGTEQITKSHGDKPKDAGPSAAETHAALRLAGGFNLNQMVSEYRALRASVTKLWEWQLTAPVPVDISDLTRFNESLDQALTESLHHYSSKIDASKDLFLSILSQDLSHPLSNITTAAGLALRIGRLHERQAMLVSEIIESAARASETVAHLLDLTRARLGSGLPVVSEPMDMGFVTRKVVDEMRAMHPRRDIKLEISGDLKGSWDKARIGQLLSNLLGNAVRYGFADSQIGVTVGGLTEEVVLSVYNEGVPIPPSAIPEIFHSLNRAAAQDGEDHPTAINLGLGLYITEEIVTAHGGAIAVTSSEEDGTTFTARFPRSMTTSPM
jgi:signal transduction histidine kinase